MLAKKHKIHGRSAIQLVFEKGKKIRLPFVQNFSIRYLLKKANGIHFSVIIPNALKLNSVQRNSARRRTYTAIRNNLELTRSKNYDIVVVVHKPLFKVKSSQIESDLTNLFKKLP